jgi:hypothetical protein
LDRPDIRRLRSKQQIDIYGGKTNTRSRGRWSAGPDALPGRPFATQLRRGRPQNLFSPAFSIYGDCRRRTTTTTVQRSAGHTRLNLDVDLHGDGRIYAVPSTDHNGKPARSPDRPRRQAEGDLVPRTLFFEGDVGNAIAGFTDKYQKYDLPIAAGLYAADLPERHLDQLGDRRRRGFDCRTQQSAWVSNFDITFLAVSTR